jgi:hypothetical protein
MALEITDLISGTVLKSDKPVLVDFGQYGADLAECWDQSSKK